MLGIEGLVTQDLPRIEPPQQRVGLGDFVPLTRGQQSP